jgi:hypothetical protein
VAPQNQPAIVIGEQGLAVIQYVGLTDIDTYEGDITGTGYLFGLFHQKSYVDSRDVQGLLAIQEEGFLVFKQVN